MFHGHFSPRKWRVGGGSLGFSEITENYEQRGDIVHKHINLDILIRLV
jgi:hypothetical protein